MTELRQMAEERRIYTRDGLFKTHPLAHAWGNKLRLFTGMKRRLVREGISAQIEFVTIWNNVMFLHFVRFHRGLRITGATFHFFFFVFFFMIIIASPLSGLLDSPGYLFGPPARRDKSNPKLNVKSF